jgi:hypothetical protein
MPDGGISQVRFEVLAFRLWAFPAVCQAQALVRIRPFLRAGLPTTSFLALVTVETLGFIKPSPLLSQEPPNTQCSFA